MKQNRYVADFSLALINRTGAYYVCRDVVERLHHFFPAIRYWRLCLKREPQGLVRKLLGRAMLYEFLLFKTMRFFGRQRHSGDSADPTLYFDPLYVLRTRLARKDIVLCHDVGPITHTELFDTATSDLYRRAYEMIRAAKPGVVFVSEASRDAFISLYGNDFRFLKVIPLYVRAAMNNGEMKAPLGVKTPFLLTVGALEVRKNHRRIISAFEKSGLRERGYSYVFCGPRGNNAEEVYALAEKTENVHGFGYLSDAEIRWLYRNASGFVLPSLLEGFGLPALEAAKHGLISVVSHEGAQKEAVGDGGILVDALSVDSIAGGMRRLVDMPAVEKQARLALIRQHADRLSYDRYISEWSELLASG